MIVHIQYISNAFYNSNNSYGRVLLYTDSKTYCIITIPGLPLYLIILCKDKKNLNVRGEFSCICMCNTGEGLGTKLIIMRDVSVSLILFQLNASFLLWLNVLIDKRPLSLASLLLPTTAHATSSQQNTK